MDWIVLLPPVEPIISSMASACDHVDHVNTQLPYALVQAGGAAVAFVLAGLLAG